jgi:hypothetical protein
MKVESVATQSRKIVMKIRQRAHDCVVVCLNYLSKLTLDVVDLIVDDALALAILLDRRLWVVFSDDVANVTLRFEGVTISRLRAVSKRVTE